MEKTKEVSRPSGFAKKFTVIIGLVGGITAATLGIWQITSKVLEGREIQKKVKIHLYSGDQFAAQGEHLQAISEYEQAIELDKGNVETHRRIIAAQRERMTLKAFGPGAVTDIALRSDYKHLAHVISGEEINDVLKQIYQLKALNPSLENDIGLLLDEALILKTNGNRTKDEVQVLDKARNFYPENPEVLAELGLAMAVPDGPMHNERGIDYIRRAIEIKPDEARYHFYLARSLDVACKPYKEYRDDVKKCAEAIRGYHHAADLASAEDYWSRQIRTCAAKKSMKIFHRYANNQGDILTWKLDMPLSERIREIEYLIPREKLASRYGVYDYPEFWLASLYVASGDTEKAEHAVRTLVDEKGDMAASWFRMYIEFLEKKGHDPKSLAELRSIKTKIERHPD